MAFRPFRCHAGGLTLLSVSVTLLGISYASSYSLLNAQPPKSDTRNEGESYLDRLKQFGTLQQLEKLTISGELSDSDFRHLKGLSRLREIHFRNARFDSFVELADLESITVLTFSDTCSLPEDSKKWHQLKRMPQLRELSGVGVEVLQAARSYPALKALRLNVRKAFYGQRKELADLADLVNLEALALRGMVGDQDRPHFVDSEDAVYLRTLVNLRELDIEHTSIGDASADSLKGMERLQQLRLEGVTGKTLEVVSKLPKLRSLGISVPVNQDLTENDLKPLASSRSLEELSINVTGVNFLSSRDTRHYWVPVEQDKSSPLYRNVMPYVKQIPNMTKDEITAYITIRQLRRELATLRISNQQVGTTALLGRLRSSRDAEWRWETEQFWLRSSHAQQSVVMRLYKEALSAAEKAFADNPEKLKRVKERINGGLRGS